MALVVLLRGVNVGGHRTFRPSTLARQLTHLDAVNIGAAGTFVIRKRVSAALLRDEFARRLPFASHIVICNASDMLGLLVRDFFSEQVVQPDMVRFVSVLARPPRSRPALPVSLPPEGEWLVRILARENRFVVGLYRRHMRTIGYLGALDRVFGVPATTRNWSTLAAIAKVVQPADAADQRRLGAGRAASARRSKRASARSTSSRGSTRR